MIPVAYIAYPLRNAKSTDDIKIERLVQRLLSDAFRQARQKNLSWQEVVCAGNEFAARLIAGGMLAADKRSNDDINLAAAMTQNITQRIVAILENKPPGSEETLQ